MKVFERLSDWREFRKTLRTPSLGFVPTMGALHEGHASLIRQSVEENASTVLSIYVNPTQFDNASDLQKYPITWEQDLILAKEAGVDYVLSPSFSEMYPDKYRFRVREDDFSQLLCGANRPGHFEGVLTVVLKLLNLVGADRAYFGEKDFQQYSLIRDMCESFFISTEIVPCPIVREENGLAMSSRNQRLSAAERASAPKFFEILSRPFDDAQVADQLAETGFRVDYVETHQGRRFGAVKVGHGKNEIRLIDNVPVR